MEHVLRDQLLKRGDNLLKQRKALSQYVKYLLFAIEVMILSDDYISTLFFQAFFDLLGLG